jgi:NADPH2:quinone reductase
VRALVCKELGPPESLVVEDVPSPSADPGQVVVSVKAAGLNFPDTLVIQGRYQFKPDLPFTPGGEAAGVVKEVGEGVNGFAPGDRVIAITGAAGAFAEEVAVSAQQLVPIPDGVGFETAAAFVFTYATSHYALRDRARLEQGETLLVLGAAGGVGLAAVQIGKAMGARVIAAASSKEKLAVCREHGADEVIDYTTEDLRARIKDLTADKGVDVVYDPVGAAYAEPAIRGMAWGGRYLVIGFAGGDIPKIPLNLTLLKGSAIVGVFWGRFTMVEPARHQELMRELLGWLAAGKVAPVISGTYPLERAADAFNDMLARKVTGKAIIVP